METETQKLQREIDELKKDINSLKNSTTIPIEIDRAFRKRFLDNIILSSKKSSTSENKTVNEAGADTYSVLNAPDGFLQTTINGTIYYLPYFT